MIDTPSQGELTSRRFRVADVKTTRGEHRNEAYDSSAFETVHVWSTLKEQTAMLKVGVNSDPSVHRKRIKLADD